MEPREPTHELDGATSINVVAAIPVYRPSAQFPELVASLVRTELRRIVVVNDGSGPGYDEVFHVVAGLPRVHVLRHAVNLGKGAALKTALNFALAEFPDIAGVVTADGDGQHDVDDIVAVATEITHHPDTLILGVRQFGRTVPLRSRVGNALTRQVLFYLTGQKLADTQTGLRGIPERLIPSLLRVPSNGYEFELDMLMLCKHRSCPIVQRTIKTIYADGNRASHFDPIKDSMRIYFVLFRFALNSLVTAVLDNSVFAALYFLGSGVVSAQVSGRMVAVLFNYTAARRIVFLSQEKHRRVFPKYIVLVVTSGLVSYGLINLLVAVFSISVLTAKIVAESLLFVANFTIQRDLIFTKRPAQPLAGTDWDLYYRRVFPTARLTRRYTTSVITSVIKRFSSSTAGPCETVVEIGGANSCFVEAIRREFAPREYHVIDNNRCGLDLLRDRLGDDRVVHLHCIDALECRLTIGADLVFSVGLIEHFSGQQLPTLVRVHLDLLRPGGIAILSFPTPTWLYRAARFSSERLGLWHFPDERPLSRSEVANAIEPLGQILYEKVLWPLVFTQRLLVVRKSLTA